MAQESMKWEKLLSRKKQGRSTENEEQPSSVGRSVFEQDYDLIVYSSAFRRMQDKAQVFPLAKSDFVRTRLTHSLEVSCVGRSLGTEVGTKLREKESLPQGIEPADIGTIVAAACLAHDIGNPPFGHSGEAAIGEWFSQNQVGKKFLKKIKLQGKKEDLKKFEGNAQGFRILTQLQFPDNPGLQLTCATLATFTKYPRESYIGEQEFDGDCWKKHGYFQSDKNTFKEVAEEVGLLKKSSKYSAWSRHPLAYLMEAADDICYRVNDLEDGFRLGHISFEKAKNLLEGLLAIDVSKRLDQISHCHDKISYLRAKAVNDLIGQTVHYFIQEEKAILQGKLKSSLTSKIKSAEALKKISDTSKEKIFKTKEVLEVEVPGFRVFAGLLKAFLSAADDVAKKGDKATKKSQLILSLVPKQYLVQDHEPKDAYTRTIKITDYVSGMTDSYAVTLYKQLMGISLPT